MLRSIGWHCRYSAKHPATSKTRRMTLATAFAIGFRRVDYLRSCSALVEKPYRVLWLIAFVSKCPLLCRVWVLIGRSTNIPNGRKL